MRFRIPKNPQPAVWRRGARHLPSPEEKDEAGRLKEKNSPSHPNTEMPRATNAPASRKRRKRILKKAKGFRGARSKLYRYAKDAIYKSQTWAYRDRKKRKGNFRRLWIQRISAAARLHDLTYSRFMEGLKASGIELDRKVLSDIAINDEAAFAALAEKAKGALEDKTQARKQAA